VARAGLTVDTSLSVVLHRTGARRVGSRPAAAIGQATAAAAASASDRLQECAGAADAQWRAVGRGCCLEAMALNDAMCSLLPLPQLLLHPPEHQEVVLGTYTALRLPQATMH
jgi:hypothetical protein